MMLFPRVPACSELQALKIPANAPCSKGGGPTNGIDPKRYGAGREPFERMNAYSKNRGHGHVPSQQTPAQGILRNAWLNEPTHGSPSRLLLQLHLVRT
ncbi:hypothetical protein, partial [Variovorax sp. Varisp62]|uniref:hypothetical protein n=1 Tax=Variovorax sp. Varisp62 TaxID=3243049 RepID=UPI0039B49510